MSPRPDVRLRLDAEDLAKLRIGAGGGPFTESLFSLRLLAARHPNPLASPWLDHVRAGQSPNVPPPVLRLVELVTDPHTMATTAPSIDESLLRLRAALVEPLPETTTALRAWSETATGPLRSWLRDLLEGDQRLVDQLVGSLHDHYHRAVAPHWRSILSHLDAERARCGHVVAHRGVGHLLATLHPKVRWRLPVLELGESGAARPRRSRRARPVVTAARPVTHVLDGRSLVLVPSAFCLDAPLILWSREDATQPAALVYPSLRTVDDAASLWAPGRARDPSALAKLLGRTQAAALAAIAETCTTTGLAHRLGISLATASHHSSILRGAGLVVSRRSGNSVVHRLSPLGADLHRGGHGTTNQTPAE